MSPTPSLAPSSAFWLSGVVASSYVASVYISQLVAPPQPPLWRNEPFVIKARLLCASISTLLCCAVVRWVVSRSMSLEGDDSSEAAWRTCLSLLGLPDAFPPTLSTSTFKHLAITPLLFLGPLYARFLSQTLPFARHWNYKEDVADVFYNWIGIRNFLVAPLTEEVNYRSCVLALLHMGGFGRRTMIFAAPCWFGLAHIHHGYETYKRLGRTQSALRGAVLSTVFQFAYTTIFGWLCSFLFLRTGSLLVVTTAHISCNIMGVPQISYELGEHPNRKHSILFAYVLGVAFFAATLVPWSHNPNSIYWTMD